jgi:hypothetical protein
MISKLLQEGKRLLEADAGEPLDNLSPKTADLHRALTSMREEIDAINLYKTLKKIFEHNRDEEKDHAAKLLEWVRQQDEEMAKKLKDNLFREKVKED